MDEMPKHLMIFRAEYQRPNIVQSYTRLYAVDADQMEIEDVWKHVLSVAMTHCEESGNVLTMIQMVDYGLLVNAEE